MTKDNNFSSAADWMTLRVSVSPDMADAVTNFLHESGSPGVVIDDNDPAHVLITTYLPKAKLEVMRHDFEQYLGRLEKLFPQTERPLFKVGPLKHENWAVAWQSHFKPIRVGKHVMITPPWLKPDPGKRKTVIIEPAEAFGTGTHETTQGCLLLLEIALRDILKRESTATLLDVGCGSGILAIAGLKLGATQARGIDNDPLAVRSARANAVLNQVQDEVAFECMSLTQYHPAADIVTANLDSRTLADNRDKLLALFESCLIISGVPLNQWQEIKNTFLCETIVLKREITRSEWGCGLFKRKADG
jgi:ribosomal protein L11 methyltransferase